MRLLVFVCLINLGCVSDIGSSPTPVAYPENSLELVLEIRPIAINIGDTLQAEVILKNVSDLALIVNKRMVFGYFDDWEEHREISFSITEISGKGNVGLSARIHSGPSSLGDFRELLPGEEILTNYELTKYYELEPGAYSIQAVYDNESDPGDGRTAWKGEIKSNIVLIEIKP